MERWEGGWELGIGYDLVAGKLAVSSKMAKNAAEMTVNKWRGADELVSKNNGNAEAAFILPRGDKMAAEGMATSMSTPPIEGAPSYLPTTAAAVFRH